MIVMPWASANFISSDTMTGAIWGSRGLTSSVKPLVQIQPDQERFVAEHANAPYSTSDKAARGEVVRQRIGHAVVGFHPELVDRQPPATVVGRAIDDEPLWYPALEFQLYRKGFAGPEPTPAVCKPNSQSDRDRRLQ
jgi:hypothetical protein